MTISLLPADFCNHEIHCSKGDRNPMHYLYDGTYPGFLTSIYEIYHYGTSHLESIAPFVGESHLFGQEYLQKKWPPPSRRTAGNGPCGGCIGLSCPMIRGGK